MSYSFSVRGATMAEVMGKVVNELEKVVRSQPIHSADRAQAQATAAAFLGLIPSRADKDFCLSVSGSVGWTDGNVITSAGVNVSASLIAKEPV